MKKKNWLMAVAIAVLFAFFIGYGIEVFHDSAQYEDYCPSRFVYESEEECSAAGGEWSDLTIEGDAAKKSCLATDDCQKAFSTAEEQHDRIVFIVALILGVLAVIAGVMVQHETISVGVLIGGVFLILYGSLRYWQHAGNVVKFILLGVALAVLVYLAYKKLK
jgi:hypothetical protein